MTKTPYVEVYYPRVEYEALLGLHAAAWTDTTEISSRAIAWEVTRSALLRATENRTHLTKEKKA